MGAFKLGKMTFGSLFKKPETVLYPIETKPKPAGLKGHIAIDVDTCILCGMCERSCATDCIGVDKQARTWHIDRLQCIQCGYCITVCPKKCLHMDPNYAPATTVHEVDSFEVPEQGKPAKEAASSDKAAAASEAAATPEAAVTAPIEKVSGEAEAATAASKATGLDAQVTALLDLMDADKAKKVKAALS